MLANEEMNESTAVWMAREVSRPMFSTNIRMPMTTATSNAHSTDGSHSFENEWREVR